MATNCFMTNSLLNRAAGALKGFFFLSVQSVPLGLAHFQQFFDANLAREKTPFVPAKD
jgi:hypothetical protein